jgi:hypothetical protein
MKDIQRIYTAHTLNTLALSFISVYVPIYFLTLGYPLSKLIFYYTLVHISGLLFGLFLFVPLMRKIGIINTLKIYYPLQITFLLFLHLLNSQNIPLEVIALLNGASIYSYWLPLNILFLRHSELKEMGSNFAKFFALPKLFGIAGPLIGALLIPLIGFWSVFLITGIGLITSFYPLVKITNTEMLVSLNLKSSFNRMMRNKSLFLFEGFDNILEESEWFWAIYVFLLIGSLSTPGIVGSLEAIGGALFTLLIGKYANKNAKSLIPVAAILLLLISITRIFISVPIHAYLISVGAAFIMTLFLVSYFSTIYKTVKHDKGEEFIILREIPTVLGRLVVFGAIYLSLSNLRFFFFLPIICITLLLILYFWKNKYLAR